MARAEPIDTSVESIGGLLRTELISEALGDLRTLLFDPGAFGDCSVQDAAVSLAGEFVTAYRDDELVRRLKELATAAQSGQLRVAGRHLRVIQRKLTTRWGVAPLTSVPLITDSEAKRLAGVARSEAAKPQVARGHVPSVSPQRVGTDG